MRGYAICTLPRSGSNLLCRILNSTGVLGHPNEYFNLRTMRTEFEDYTYVPEEQLKEILRLGATANGVYGVKIFPYEFDRIRAIQWAKRLPSLSFINLVRLDVLGQAISNVRARQTDQWWAHDPIKAEPVYDFELLTSAVRTILRGRARWSYYFARNGVPVLHLFYEQITQAPQQCCEAVGAFLGLETAPVMDPGLVNMVIQRDAINEEWRARFTAEAGDLGAFPPVRAKDQTGE
jgi:LPS sulfotransferase NodH